MIVDTGKKEIKIYYNSACPVCDASISSQKGKMAGCAVRWNDVNTDVQVRAEMPAQLEFVRERLHAIDERGDIKVGIDAFEVIWRHSPSEHWKATLIALPIVKPMAVIAYNIFARLLYRWNVRKGHWKIT